MISVHKPGLTHIYQVYLVNVERTQVLQTLSYLYIYQASQMHNNSRKQEETYPPSRFYIYQVSRFFIGSSLDIAENVKPGFGKSDWLTICSGNLRHICY